MVLKLVFWQNVDQQFQLRLIVLLIVSMWFFGVVLVILCLVFIVLVFFEGNLNYESFFCCYVGFGFDVLLIERRLWKCDSVIYRVDQFSFIYGVVFGDFWVDSVILWICIVFLKKFDDSEVIVDGIVLIYSYEIEKYIKVDVNLICVEWKVFGSKKNKLIGKVVKKGKVYIILDIDYIVKVN